MDKPQIPGHRGCVTPAGDGIKWMPVMPAGLGEVFRGASAGRALQMDVDAACSHCSAGKINPRASLQALGS